MKAFYFEYYDCNSRPGSGPGPGLKKFNEPGPGLDPGSKNFFESGPGTGPGPK